MRVVLKPAGLAIILTAFAALAWIIIYLTQSLRAKEAEALPPSANPATQKSLRNGGFEDEYRPPTNYAGKGVLKGYVAYPWMDDSNWSPVTVAYEKETQNPHGGKACQKVTVEKVPTDVEARVQFAQELNLEKGKKYRATAWLRADQPLDIDFAIRQRAEPYRYYGMNKVKLGTKWQKVEVTGTVENEGLTFVMFKISKPVTYWVDDVSIKPE
jgi:hypothetical protein